LLEATIGVACDIEDLQALFSTIHVDWHLLDSAKRCSDLPQFRAGGRISHASADRGYVEERFDAPEGRTPAPFQMSLRRHAR
jgi:hypothetical protein